MLSTWKLTIGYSGGEGTGGEGPGGGGQHGQGGGTGGEEPTGALCTGFTLVLFKIFN